MGNGPTDSINKIHNQVYTSLSHHATELLKNPQDTNTSINSNIYINNPPTIDPINDIKTIQFLKLNARSPSLKISVPLDNS